VGTHSLKKRARAGLGAKALQSDLFLSLIGTERTLDIMMPSEESRTYLFARFQLLLAKLKSSSSRAARSR
jgi:hypothetical protein